MKSEVVPLEILHTLFSRTPDALSPITWPRSIYRRVSGHKGLIFYLNYCYGWGVPSCSHFTLFRPFFKSGHGPYTIHESFTINSEIITKVISLLSRSMWRHLKSDSGGVDPREFYEVSPTLREFSFMVHEKRTRIDLKRPFLWDFLRRGTQGRSCGLTRS